MTKIERKNFRSVRLVMLLVILAGLTVIGAMHQLVGSGRPVGADAFCPFGGLEAAWALLSSGTFIQRIAWSSFILLAATIITALVFRRTFCGNICTLGTLQELFAKLGRKIFKRNFVMPAAVDKPLRWLKYIVLVLVVGLSALTGTLVIRPYDPWLAYMHITSSTLLSELLIGVIVLAAALIGSLLYDRFFCKYLCPVGGFLAIVGKIGWFRISRNERTCTDCKACTKACPVNIQVHTLKTVTSTECINCNLCVAACPVNKTLEIVAPAGKDAAGAARTVAIGPMKMLLATVLIFGLVVGVSTVLGGFTWTEKSLTELTEKSGKFNPDDLKGSHLFADVAKQSGIDKEKFIQQFGMNEAEFNGPIKDFAHKPGSKFDTDVIREWIRANLPKK